MNNDDVINISDNLAAAEIELQVNYKSKLSDYTTREIYHLYATHRIGFIWI